MPTRLLTPPTRHSDATWPADQYARSIPPERAKPGVRKLDMRGLDAVVPREMEESEEQAANGLKGAPTDDWHPYADTWAEAARVAREE